MTRARVRAKAKVLDTHAWKIIAFAEIAGFGYLFWAIYNAAHIGLANL